MNLTTHRLPAILALHSDPVVRSGVVAALRRHTDFDAFEDGGGGVELDACAIDVVIADYEQAMRWVDPIRRAGHGSLGEARILVFTTNDRSTDIRRASAAGVGGYLLIGDPVEELVVGVTALVQGGRYLSRSVVERIADSLMNPLLTSRELDVLRLVATGDCNRAIARQLRLEVDTVKMDMSAILGKLNAGSRTQAAAIAMTRGLIERQVLVTPKTLALRRSPIEAIPRPA